MIPKGPSYSWKKAALFIGLSTLFSFAAAAFCYVLMPQDQPILAIVQTTSGEKLQTACLAEMLELGCDDPISCAHFPLKEAKARLLGKEIFADLSLAKVGPGSLHIDYRLREPIGRLGNSTNLVIDVEGNIFPLAPFYSPRRLPTVYLSEDPPMDVLLHILSKKPRLVDLSAIDAPTLGKRQIVMQMEDGTWLRLSVKGFKAELARFDALAKIELAGRIVDLRIPNVAYIDD